jgi:hypothetical protein
MLLYALKMAVVIAFLRENAVEIIEIKKKKLCDNNIIARKQQLLGIILCCFMHLKWPWLLYFFAKMM